MRSAPSPDTQRLQIGRRVGPAYGDVDRIAAVEQLTRELETNSPVCPRYDPPHHRL
jgi:hypothetical protein